LNYPVRRDVGDLLLEERLITEGVLRAARRLAKRERMPVVSVLLEEEHLSEDQLVELLMRRLKLPVVDPGRLHVDEDVLREIPYDLAEKHRVLPVGLEKDEARGTSRLRTAMADPLDREALEELQAHTGHSIEPVVAPAMALLAAIRFRYRGAITQLLPRGGRVSLVTPSSAQTPTPDRRHPEDMVTQPLLRIGEDAPLELRLKALLVTLIGAGVISERAYAEALRRLTRETSE
jgi:hypothetical protein